MEVTHCKTNTNIRLKAIDYYPGGMQQPGRDWQAGTKTYRYSINGQEVESELNKNITTALYWEYDSRIVRRWNRDPKASKMSSWSSYSAMYDNPIKYNDPTGAEPEDWIKNSKTGKYEWRSEVTSASNTPKGYSYVGKQDNDIVKDLGYPTTVQKKSTTELGIIHADVQEGNPQLYIADYSASHAVSININTSVSVSANVTSTWDNHGITKSKEFKGLNIDIATKVTSSSEEKLMTTAEVSFRAAGKKVNFQLGENSYAPGTAVVTQVGATYLTGSITMTASQAMQKTSIPAINISGTFWRQDGSYSLPVYPIPILSGQLNPISPLEYSQTIVPPLKR